MRLKKIKKETSKMKWVCEECQSIMEVTREDDEKRLVHCPNCGNEYYIDNDDEVIEDLWMLM